MGKAKVSISRMETVSSFPKPSLTRGSSTCSLDEEFLPASPKSALKKLNSRIKQINASRNKTSRKSERNYVTFAQNGKIKGVRFACYDEKEVFTFSKGVSGKLPRITEDFDVESDEELIGKAIDSGVRSFMRMVQGQNNH